MYTELIVHWAGRAARGLLDICALAPPLLLRGWQMPLTEPSFIMSPCAVDVSCMAWVSSMGEVAEDLSAIFKVSRQKTALAPAQ